MLHFTPEINLGTLVNTVAIIVALIGISRRFFKRIMVMEMKINILFEKNATLEEKTLVRQYSRQLGFKNRNEA